MRQIIKSFWLLSALIFAGPMPARAANLDITTEYRVRDLSYVNLNLDSSNKNNHSFISQNARLGFSLKDIHLGDVGGDGATLDIGMKLHAVGIAGSTTAFNPPFDRIADNYPNTGFIPFFENAFVNVHQLEGLPLDLILGRQSFRLGSGLLLDDDGAGLTGINALAHLPWWGINTQAFAFQARSIQTGSNTLDLYGLTVEFPTDGTWQINELLENDHSIQTLPVTACPGGCLISQVKRLFTSVRYQLNYGPIVFDGEGAIEKGAATPTGTTPLGNHITFNGNAQVVRAKWKQTFYNDIRGITRISVARGSGTDGSTPSTDREFFPSHGHRFDGMERSGMGEFFGASPYDAFGGQSTATANGLQRGASGIVAVGIGLTPPAYHDIVLDLDYYIFQADRNVGPARTLGTEYDIRIRRDFQDRFTLRASAAIFRAGPASNANKSASRRFMLEASGKF